MVVPVSDVDVSRFVDRNRNGLVEARGATDTVSFSFFAIASECADIAVRGDNTDGMIAAITHVDVPASVNREAVGTIELPDLLIAVGQTRLTGSRKRLDPNDHQLGDCNIRHPQYHDADEQQPLGQASRPPNAAAQRDIKRRI